MEQLLDITIVPIKINVTVTKPKFERADNDADKVSVAEQVRKKAIANPVKSTADNRELIESTARRKDVFVQSDDNGFKISYSANAKLSGGKALPEGTKNISSDELAQKQIENSIDRIMSKISGSGAKNISWENGALNLNYSAEQLGIDWEAADTVGFEFTPGDIEFHVEQMPHVEIEYTGGPIYVPRSADPNYQPPLDVKA